MLHSALSCPGVRQHSFRIQAALKGKDALKQTQDRVHAAPTMLVNRRQRCYAARRLNARHRLGAS
jgi:hypothetical protein